MKQDRKIGVPQAAVLGAALVLFLVWLVPNFARLVQTQNGAIRLGLATLFSFLILFRRRPKVAEPSLPRWTVLLSAAIGLPMAILGIVFDVHQVAWLGLVMVLFACLQWSLPRDFSRDVLRAVFLLYWAHPIPGQVFGPLQLAMQYASVNGTEWFLHMTNYRAWADGLILRTGFAAYEVPAWCSGMRTATTVFLLGLGVGILKRFKWYECLVVTVLAVIQALVMNVLRISAMVFFTPRIGNWTGIDFLHDTAGFIVILTVFIVYLEVSLWQDAKRRRTALRRELDVERLKALTELPPFWSSVVRHKRAAVIIVVILLLAAGLAFKSRRYHRAEMLRGVAAGLYQGGDVDNALRAAAIVRDLRPDDTDWHMTIIRMLLVGGRYQLVLEELVTVPKGTERRAVEKQILKAYALMALGEMKVAADIVMTLPRRQKEADPRVAMILAEMGFEANDPDSVAEHVTVASRWAPNTSRIRALYPYLRRYRKWDGIADSDLQVPYAEPVEALSAMEAYMNLNQGPVVASMVLRAVREWPEDPRVLEPLFFMALKRADTRWEDRFAAHLFRTANAIEDPVVLHKLADKCFQLSRPDLAWFLVRRISSIDPTSPLLSMIAARHGNQWFSFRKRRLGLSAAQSVDTIDLKPFFLLGRSLPGWQDLCRDVPLGAEMSVADAVSVRRKFLDKALEEFESRAAVNTLTLPMHYECVLALEVAGRAGDAREWLLRIAEAYPDEREKCRISLSEIYERSGDWQNVYETLRTYHAHPNAQLSPLVRLCRAQLNLRLGPASIFVAREAVRLFPRSTQAATVLATALTRYDSPEEALFSLTRPLARKQRDLHVIEAEALFKTKRFAELESFTHSALLPRIPVPTSMRQPLFLPPAELSVVWHWRATFSDQAVAAHARDLEKIRGITTSPFLLRMGKLWLQCYESGCDAEWAEMDKWLACGRDRIEKAVALHQLTILLCWKRRFVEARNVIGVAVKLFPESPVLWRTLVSLSGGDLEVVAAARHCCPDDPEIWLAEIVLKTAHVTGEDYSPRRKGEWPEEKLVQVISSATSPAPRYSPAAVLRAGEYLFRCGMKRAAILAAKDAIKRARGLLPAYVFGIRCALDAQDRDWALECTQQAIMLSVHPRTLFYEKLVQLKTTDATVDADAAMVDALKQLRKADPNNPLWAQMLGYVRFQRGGPEIVDALDEMQYALQAGATNRVPFLVGAEAARMSGNIARAVKLLQMGLARYPDDLAMLNNLAYALAFNPERVAEAEEILPILLERGKGDPRIMDTIAVVYLRTGRLSEAKGIATGLLDQLEAGSPAWFRVSMRKAEIALAEDRPSEAVTIIRDSLKVSRSVPDEDVLAASELLAKSELREIEKKAADEKTSPTTD